MHATSSDPRDTPRPALRFVRHGATSANLAGLRCGGDLDLPLTATGREQATAAARVIARLDPPVGLILCSHLLRTRETAAIIASALPGVPIVIDPAFAERSLGDWNLRPIDETQASLDAGCTPPGGESGAAFSARVTAALQRLRPRLADRPLLVGSKGVARVMAELAGLHRPDLGNGVVTEFELDGSGP